MAETQQQQQQQHQGLATRPQPLTKDLMAKGLTVITKTGNGLGHAYINLTLRSNAITNIDILLNYPHLRYVDLSQNEITNLEGLEKLEYLLYLNLAENKVQSIASCLDSRRHWQYANLSRNLIKQWPLKSLPMMQYMNLNNNQLMEIELEEYPELITLEARENKITDILPLNAPKLKNLYLSFNKLNSISGLGKLESLERLYLRGNELTSTDGLLASLKNLVHLNLRSNLIDSFDEVKKLSALPKLISLNLIDNPLRESADYRLHILGRLPRLERLDKEPVTDEELEKSKNFSADIPNSASARRPPPKPAAVEDMPADEDVTNENPSA